MSKLPKLLDHLTGTMHCYIQGSEFKPRTHDTSLIHLKK